MDSHACDRLASVQNLEVTRTKGRMYTCSVVNNCHRNLKKVKDVKLNDEQKQTNCAIERVYLVKLKSYMLKIDF